jgi:hypothetical protein
MIFDMADFETSSHLQIHLKPVCLYQSNHNPNYVKFENMMQEPTGVQPSST